MLLDDFESGCYLFLGTLGLNVRNCRIQRLNVDERGREVLLVRELDKQKLMG